MSQQELAHQAQIDRTYVSQLERGLANPSLSVLIALTISLKIPLKSLIDKDK
jgi:transcriptional regulator with XRE-family HTH domain